MQWQSRYKRNMKFLLPFPCYLRNYNSRSKFSKNTFSSTSTYNKQKVWKLLWYGRQIEEASIDTVIVNTWELGCIYSLEWKYLNQDYIGSSMKRFQYGWFGSKHAKEHQGWKNDLGLEFLNANHVGLPLQNPAGVFYLFVVSLLSSES